MNHMNMITVFFCLHSVCVDLRSQDSSFRTGTSYGLYSQGSILGRAIDFSLRHSGQTGSEAHPPSYTMDTGGFFPEGKSVSFWRWPLISI
jgi:hypothetical protein